MMRMMRKFLRKLLIIFDFDEIAKIKNEVIKMNSFYE